MITIGALRTMHTIKLLLISFGAQVSTNHNGVFPGCTVHFDWLKVWQVSAPVLLYFKLYSGKDSYRDGRNTPH